MWAVVAFIKHVLGPGLHSVFVHLWDQHASTSQLMAPSSWDVFFLLSTEVCAGAMLSGTVCYMQLFLEPTCLPALWELSFPHGCRV